MVPETRSFDVWTLLWFQMFTVVLGLTQKLPTELRLCKARYNFLFVQALIIYLLYFQLSSPIFYAFFPLTVILIVTILWLSQVFMIDNHPFLNYLFLFSVTSKTKIQNDTNNWGIQVKTWPTIEVQWLKPVLFCLHLSFKLWLLH
jgi:hypothetical protein